MLKMCKMTKSAKMGADVLMTKVKMALHVIVHLGLLETSVKQVMASTKITFNYALYN